GSNNVNVMMISQGSSEATISCVVARGDVDKAVRALQLALLGQGYVDRITEEKDACIIAVVGSGMKGTPGVAARVFGAIARRKVTFVWSPKGLQNTTSLSLFRRKMAQKLSEHSTKNSISEHRSLSPGEISHRDYLIDFKRGTKGSPSRYLGKADASPRLHWIFPPSYEIICRFAFNHQTLNF